MENFSKEDFFQSPQINLDSLVKDRGYDSSQAEYLKNLIAQIVELKQGKSFLELEKEAFDLKTFQEKKDMLLRLRKLKKLLETFESILHQENQSIYEINKSQEQKALEIAELITDDFEKYDVLHNLANKKAKAGSEDLPEALEAMEDIFNKWLERSEYKTLISNYFWTKAKILSQTKDLPEIENCLSEVENEEKEQSILENTAEGISFKLCKAGILAEMARIEFEEKKQTADEIILKALDFLKTSSHRTFEGSDFGIYKILKSDFKEVFLEIYKILLQYKGIDFAEKQRDEVDKSQHAQGAISNKDFNVEKFMASLSKDDLKAAESELLFMRVEMKKTQCQIYLINAFADNGDIASAESFFEQALKNIETFEFQEASRAVFLLSKAKIKTVNTEALIKARIKKLEKQRTGKHKAGDSMISAEGFAYLFLAKNNLEIDEKSQADSLNSSMQSFDRTLFYKQGEAILKLAEILKDFPEELLKRFPAVAEHILFLERDEDLKAHKIPALRDLAKAMILAKDPAYEDYLERFFQRILKIKDSQEKNEALKDLANIYLDLAYKKLF